MEANLGSVGMALFVLAATPGCANDGSAGRNATRPADAAAQRMAETGAAEAGAPLRFFTGTVEGTDARIAVVAARRHARLYFCGGDSSYTYLSRWVPAAIESSGKLVPDPAAEIDWVIEGTLAAGAVSGSLRPGEGGAYNFHAASVDDHTIAGLYEGTSPCGKVGLIVSQSSPGDAPVAQGACISSSGTGNADVHQVNPVGPLDRTADGTIAVEVAGIAEMLQLTPALVAD